MKRTLFVIILLFISSNVFSEEYDPPFSQEQYLKINGNNLIPGFSNRKETIDIWGMPEHTIEETYGGEDWYWEGMIIDYYQNESIALIYEVTYQRLIQIIYRVQVNDKYSIFLDCDENSTINNIKEKLAKNKIEYTVLNEKVLRVDFFSCADPMYSVLCEIQRTDEDKIFLLNYFINGPWWKNE